MTAAAATLLKEIRGCTMCASQLPVEPRPVLQADPDARILIASQAPGRAVFETGIPFNDPSGVKLREWLGVSSEEFYDKKRFAIVPMGFCYPGKGRSGDLPPRKECAPAWRGRLLETLQRIDLVVAVGAYAVAYHTSEKSSLTSAVKDWKRWHPVLVPVPHPSPRNIHWLQSNPWFEMEVLPALQGRVREVLEAA